MRSLGLPQSACDQIDSSSEAGRRSSMLACSTLVRSGKRSGESTTSWPGGAGQRPALENLLDVVALLELREIGVLLRAYDALSGSSTRPSGLWMRRRKMRRTSRPSIERAAGLRALLDVGRARDAAQIVERVAKEPSVADDIALGVLEHRGRGVGKRAALAIGGDAARPLRPRAPARGSRRGWWRALPSDPGTSAARQHVAHQSRLELRGRSGQEEAERGTVRSAGSIAS